MEFPVAALNMVCFMSAPTSLSSLSPSRVLRNPLILMNSAFWDVLGSKLISAYARA